ncbi:MAG: flagellar hook-associated protein 3 [Bdellovibrio sp.]|nr:MAG: flagellar hook-associated protein 3 [Bdellovibrio sp.]
MTFDQVNQNLAKNRAEMANLQDQAATQKRVTKPSDDPVAASRVLSSRVDVQGIKQYVKNLNYAKSFLEFTDQSLDELTGHLVRAKELALAQANDASANAETRRVVATEIEQIYKQIVRVANRKLGDRYIFGGFSTTRPPFDSSGKYFGDDGEMLVHVDKGSFLGMNIPGSKVFLGKGLSQDGIAHPSMEQPTTIEELLAQRGEKPREDSRADQRSTQKQERSHRAHIKLRQPASAKEKEESEEESIGNGGVNVFQVLKKLDVALMTNDKKGVQDTLDLLDAAINQVVLGRSQVGSRVMAIDTALDTLEKNKVDNLVYASQLEDADVFKVMSDITKTEGTLQATLQTSGKLIQPSLLEFLR